MRSTTDRIQKLYLAILGAQRSWRHSPSRSRRRSPERPRRLRPWLRTTSRSRVSPARPGSARSFARRGAPGPGRRRSSTSSGGSAARAQGRPTHRTAAGSATRTTRTRASRGGRGFRIRSQVVARNADGQDTATSNLTAVITAARAGEHRRAVDLEDRGRRQPAAGEPGRVGRATSRSRTRSSTAAAPRGTTAARSWGERHDVRGPGTATPAGRSACA